MRRWLKKGILVVCLFSTHLIFSQQANDSARIRNLYSFAKLYGYVRYFYPGDEALKINFPKFARYAIPKVEKATSKAELKTILDSLFLPIAPGIKIYTDDAPQSFRVGELMPFTQPGDLKTISWQHLGYGLKPNAIYMEGRTNRFKHNGETFGNLLTSFPAEKFRNKRIKLTAAVKTQVEYKEGQGQLWLRVDRPDKKRGFFDNMHDRPITSDKWKQYHIEGKVDEDATAITFGCFLSGKGELWVDDISFSFLNDKNEWQKIDSLDGTFENTDPGELSSQWYSPTKTYQTSVTTTVAFSGKGSVHIRDRESLFPERTRAGDHVNKPIGSGLGLILPLAVYGNQECTFPLPDKSRFYMLSGSVANEISDVFDMNDTHVRIGAAISFWNVFQHFYPYFGEVNVDWEAQLQPLIAEAISAKTPRDFMHTLEKYLALLQDGHGSVQLENDRSSYGVLPVYLDWIENQLVITKVFDKNSGLERGDIILEINHVDSRIYIDSVMAYASGATYAYKMLRSINRIMSGDNGSELLLAVKKETGVKNISLKRSNLWAYDFSECKKINNDSIKKLNSHTYYINVNNTSTEFFNAKLSELAKAGSIILDFRGYPFKLRHTFISHFLTQKDTDAKRFQVPRIIYPDHKNSTYSYSGWKLAPKEPHIGARVIVITDASAISAAESYLSYFEGYKLGTLIGQPSAGTNGNICPILLSGVYNIRWTGMHVVKHDGSRHHGVGILPDISIERTLKGVKEGRDEFLEKATELAK